ncbi:UDP-N-acetylmuramoylalanine--D-glutamate ligase [Bradyrhizobium sp. i1.7.7]
MIPVTSFAGKTVAVFGLGGSGFASCHALKAGGAEVIAADDNAENVAKAAQAGFITADLRNVSWANFAALVLAPGVPLTHPVPHWSVLKAREAGVEVIGDIELFCRERRRHAPNAPFVAITGTNGKSTTTALIAHLTKVAGYDTQMGGNIGTAILSLEPPRTGRVHVIEMSSYQIDLTPSLDPSVGILLNVSEDHIDRHGTLAHYAAVKERLVAGVQAGGTAIVGVDDGFCRDIADRLDRAGKNVVRISVKNPLASGIHVEHGTIVRTAGGARSEVAKLGGIGSLRGQHNAQNAACAAAAALAMGISLDVLQNGLRSFPGPRASHGAGRPPRQRAVRQRLQGHQCGCHRACAVVLFGNLLDRRRQAQGRRHHWPDRLLPAHPQGLSDRRGRAGVFGNAGHAGGARDQPDAGHRRRARRARCRSLGPRGCSGAAVTRLRVLRPVPQFRDPRHQVPRAGTGAAGCEAGGVGRGYSLLRCRRPA